MPARQRAPHHGGPGVIRLTGSYHPRPYGGFRRPTSQPASDNRGKPGPVAAGANEGSAAQLNLGGAQPQHRRAPLVPLCRDHNAARHFRRSGTMRYAPAPL
jgi:hypothetical protein